MNAKMSEKGFTLVELMIAMAAALIVLGAIINAFLSQSKSYEQQAQIIEMQENARAGIQMMTRELMMAGYDPTGNAGAGIVLAESDNIQFTADLDGDGCTDGSDGSTDSNEDVTCALDTTDNQLTRKGTTGGNADPLAENIQGLVFTYYDGNNDPLSAPVTNVADIRRVTIQLTARTRKPDPNYPSNSGYRTRTLTSDVVPRNLGL